MPKSNRSESFGALDWALPLTGLALALLLAFGIGWIQAREDYRHQYTPASYAAAAKLDAEHACLGTDPRAVFECVNERAKTAYQTAHDEQDLMAQQRAASSALASAVLSFLALVLSGVGVWYVKRTLDATLDAVEETSAATVAMQNANRIAANTQRPWISISAELLGISQTENRCTNIECRVNFENTGHMVAEHFYAKVKFVPMGEPFLDHQKGWFDRFEDEIETRDTVVIPGQSYEAIFQSINANEWLPWAVEEGYRKDCYLMVIAMARYRIPGDEAWRFAMKCFSIGENVSHIDNRHVIYDSIGSLDMSRAIIQPTGRSRAT